jgi:hypothetical protein
MAQNPLLRDLRSYLKEVKNGYKPLELGVLSSLVCLSIDSGSENDRTIKDIYRTFDKYTPKMTSQQSREIRRAALRAFDEHRRKESGLVSRAK